ncbi:MAG TPA: hypothetical protein VFF33_00470, partial [Ignavibacteriaceae bacterium]|nr:hypothetical protein [Ignavibacteriaceae bacterium]
MKLVTFFILIFVLDVLAQAPEGVIKNYYITPYGSSGGTGTYDNPFKWPEDFSFKNISGTDVYLWFFEGVYDQSYDNDLLLIPPDIGFHSLTISNYENDNVEFNGKGIMNIGVSAERSSPTIAISDFLRINGIHFKNFKQHAIKTRGRYQSSVYYPETMNTVIVENCVIDSIVGDTTSNSNSASIMIQVSNNVSA